MKQIITSIALFLFAGYIGIFGGKIALFRDGQTEPERVFPYAVESLPPQAQKALEKGIPFESLEKLAGLLETYLS